MADGYSAFLTCDLNKLLCDERTCHGCSQKILVLIDSVSLYTGNDVFIGEFVGNIEDIELFCTAGFSSFLKSVKL